MSSGGEKLRRKRMRLYRQQAGLCFWCKQPMQLLSAAECQAQQRNLPRNLCTLDHLEPRWHPDRGKHPGAYRVVAACLACNNARDREMVSKIPREILNAAAQGVRATVLARNHEAALIGLHPVVALPKRRGVRIKHSPSAPIVGKQLTCVFIDEAEPLRVPLAEFTCRE